jgi:hypothetical protein
LLGICCWCIPKIFILYISLLYIPLSSCFFHDTKCIFHHDWHYPEMAGNQLSCHFTQESRPKMQVKKVDYLSFLSSSLVCNHIWLPHLLQDCKERRCQDQNKKLEVLVGFLHKSTWAVHPLAIFEILKDMANAHKSTGSWRMLLCKHMANLIIFETK